MSVEATVADGIGRLVLSHPPVNVLTREVMAQLRERLASLASDAALRVLVLEAEGKHFSAGADVAEHLPPDYEAMIPEFLDTVAAIDAFPLPVIAAVRGRCLGGGFELVQAVDIVIAGEGASFGQPEILLGVLPPAACALLPELCAPGVAAEIVLTGDPLSADEAVLAGLVRRVVPDDRVHDEAHALAQRIARHSRAALELTKRALKGDALERRRAALDSIGRIYTNELMQTEDAVEGLRSFIEKRPPSWRHR